MIRYKYDVGVDKIPSIIQELQLGNIKTIGIDTETDGLDPLYSSPYQIIIGWVDSKGFFQHYVINTEARDENVTKYVQMLMTELSDWKYHVIYHNASFDIKMIQNLGVHYEPTNFFCTMMAISHITKLSSSGLKQAASILKLRSRFTHLDAIWNEFEKAPTGPEKAEVIERALAQGELPESGPLMNNIAKLKDGTPTEYFHMLFNEPDKLRDFYIELQANEIGEQFKKFAKQKFNWEDSWKDTFNFIYDVYSFGPRFDEAREVIRAFNKEVLGYKNEWVKAFSGTKFNIVSFEKLQKTDPAAMMLYAGMDVMLTLNLFNFLKGEMLRTNFSDDSKKVLQQDFDVVLPIIMQEKTGFSIDVEYIESTLVETKKALLGVNHAIANKFNFITKDATWKDELGYLEDKLLQANNYKDYNTLFEKYIPYLPLPVFVDNKKKIKLDTVKKLINYIKLVIGSVKNEEHDEELVEAFKGANSKDIVKILVGEDGKDGLFKDIFVKMYNAGQEIVAAREAEIAEAHANNKVKKLRKEEQAIKDILSTETRALDVIERLYLESAKVRKVGNAELKRLGLEICPATRTINKTTNDTLLRVEIDETKLTEDQVAIAKEGKEIIRLKAVEATLLKWISTYQIKLLAMYGMSKDERIRTSYLISKAVTGRLSTDVHQFPKGGIMDPFDQERKIFEPRRVFLTTGLPEWGEEKAYHAYLDFSQMELRGAAEFTLQSNKPDLNLLRAYVPFNCFSKEYGLFKIKEHKKLWHSVEWYLDSEFKEKWTTLDLHLEPVKIAFPELFENGEVKEGKEKEVAKYRGATKSVNFGKIYGQGKSGLLGAPTLAEFPKEALSAIYDAQELAYPKLKDWMKEVIRHVNTKGFITNLQGRKYIKGFPFGKNKFNNASGYQEAYKGVNYLVQGESAGQLKARMIQIYKFIKDNNLRMRMLQNVHDEVAYLIPESELHYIFNLQELMEDFPWDVNMVSDMEITGTNWAEKHEIKTQEDINEYVENLKK